MLKKCFNINLRVIRHETALVSSSPFQLGERIESFCLKAWNGCSPVDNFFLYAVKTAQCRAPHEIIKRFLCISLMRKSSDSQKKVSQMCVLGRWGVWCRRGKRYSPKPQKWAVVVEVTRWSFIWGFLSTSCCTSCSTNVSSLSFRPSHVKENPGLLLRWPANYITSCRAGCILHDLLFS